MLYPSRNHSFPPNIDAFDLTSVGELLQENEYRAYLKTRPDEAMKVLRVLNGLPAVPVEVEDEEDEEEEEEENEAGLEEEDEDEEEAGALALAGGDEEEGEGEDGTEDDEEEEPGSGLTLDMLDLEPLPVPLGDAVYAKALEGNLRPGDVLFVPQGAVLSWRSIEISHASNVSKEPPKQAAIGTPTPAADVAVPEGGDEGNGTATAVQEGNATDQAVPEGSDTAVEAVSDAKADPDAMQVATGDESDPTRFSPSVQVDIGRWTEPRMETSAPASAADEAVDVEASAGNAVVAGTPGPLHKSQTTAPLPPPVKRDVAALRSSVPSLDEAGEALVVEHCFLDASNLNGVRHELAHRALKDSAINGLLEAIQSEALDTFMERKPVSMDLLDYRTWPRPVSAKKAAEDAGQPKTAKERALARRNAKKGTGVRTTHTGNRSAANVDCCGHGMSQRGSQQPPGHAIDCLT